MDLTKELRMNELKNKKFALLATDGFEKSEFVEPKHAVEQAGGEVHVISISSEPIKAWTEDHWDGEMKVDKLLSESSADDYDGLILPGGVINPDLLRKEAKAINFIKGFFKENKQKPVAAICHAPWTLIEAGVVKGRKMTSYASIKTDLMNAGANWVDQEVVVDNGLVTSRSPEDMKAFCDKMVEEFGEGTHRR